MSIFNIFRRGRNLIRGIEYAHDMYARQGNGVMEYHFFGPDPRCFLQLHGEHGRGWYAFDVSYLPAQGLLSYPKLYIDRGKGYYEEEAIQLDSSSGTIKKIFFSPGKLKQVRFDPTDESPGMAAVSAISLISLSPLDIIRKLYRKMRVAPGTGIAFKTLLTAILFFFTRRSRQIEDIITREPVAPDPFGYREWIKKHDLYTATEQAVFRARQAHFSYRPKISVVVPVYNTALPWLKDCIESVLGQVYDNWELCIADDHSPVNAVRDTISQYAQSNDKIKYIFRNAQGNISASSNSALSLASGEFTCFLDHDDTLAPLALFRLVEDLNQNRHTDFFYSDEDKLDEQGERALPFFKPDWSPTLFYAQNYITHLACIRTALIRQVNGFTEGLEGSQDYDLYLKVIATGASIRHLPYILYHWRMHTDSTSMHSGAKPYAHAAGRLALESHLSARYPLLYKNIENGEYTFTYLPRFKLNPADMISIIIPTKDRIDYLAPCIESILHSSTWPNYEIIIINNNSVEPASYAYFNTITQKNNRVKLIHSPFPFNWSMLNNAGAAAANGQFLIFLNNDVKVITPDWMERLCEYAGLPDIAAVGASLLYEDNTLQHAGVVVGMNGWADHVFKGMQPSHFPAPFVSNEIPRNVLAVTGACMAVEAIKFEWLGQFDESFTICGSDVEFCIRAHKKNLYNAILANVKLYHYESKSRGTFIPENDFVQSALKYEPYRTTLTDPYFNPNLSIMQTSPVCKP